MELGLYLVCFVVNLQESRELCAASSKAPHRAVGSFGHASWSGVSMGNGGRLTSARFPLMLVDFDGVDGGLPANKDSGVDSWLGRISDSATGLQLSQQRWVGAR